MHNGHKSDFEYSVTDANSETWKWRVYLSENIITGQCKSHMNNNNNGMPYDDTLRHLHKFAIRETNSGIEIFNQMWMTPAEELLKAYAEYKGDKVLLEE